ncbi:hypothetical protein JHK84_045288 [Glycine max]|nr:hypothetical protein JHK84_045288 [Glycine max]
MDSIFYVLTHYSEATGRLVCRKRSNIPDVGRENEIRPFGNPKGSDSANLDSATEGILNVMHRHGHCTIGLNVTLTGESL